MLEAGIVGLAAGGLGVAVAVVGLRALRAVAPPTLPRLDQVSVDMPLVLFCLLLSIATVCVFGLLPALQTSRSNLAELLKEGGRGASGRRHRLQDALVVLQMAVGLVLLTGAGLLVRSFAHFERMDPGFRPDRVVTAQVAFAHERYPTPERLGIFLTDLVDRLQKQPGITTASLSTWLPGIGTPFELPFAIVGEAPPDPSHTPAASRDIVSPAYFTTMGIGLERGRSLAATDDARAVKVAVVDELLARRFFGGRDPVGRQLVLAIPTLDTVQIVGVVRAVRQFGLVADEVPEIYLPLAQHLARRNAAWVALRTTGDAGPPIRALKQVVSDLEPNVPVSDVKSMDARMVQTIGTTRFASLLASLFALVALVLGALGLYSVLAYIVTQRRRDLAIRIALGASHSQVMGEVTRRAAALAAAGIAWGVISAWILTRVLAGIFVDVSPHEPDVFIGAAVGFVVVALLSASVPAFRTTRVNPVTVLTSS